MIPIDPFANHLKTDRPLNDGIIVAIFAFIRQLHKQLTSISTVLVGNINDSIINRIKDLIKLLPPLCVKRIRLTDQRRTTSPPRFLRDGSGGINNVF